MSNLEFMLVLMKAMWPIPLFVGIIWAIIIVNAVLNRKNRKKHVTFYHR
jgi:hypothetical protein